MNPSQSADLPQDMPLSDDERTEESSIQVDFF